MAEPDRDAGAGLAAVLQLQRALSAARDERQLIEALVAGLLAVPGVRHAAVALGGEVIAASPGLAGHACVGLEAEACRARPEACDWHDPGLVALPLRTAAGVQGTVLLRAKDTTALDAQAPLLAATLDLAAARLESARQAEELAATRATLASHLREGAATIERLAASEQRYRLLADHTHDVIWTLDLASARFTYISPSIVRLRGLTVAEALAEPLAQSMTPESLARVAALLAKIGTPDEQDPHVGVYDQHCKDGTIKHVEVHTALVRDAAGRPATVLGVSRDATARVDAERALQARERWQHTVLQGALDAIWTVGPEGAIEEVNDAACAMLGYTREELCALRVADIEAHEHPDQIAARIAGIRATGRARFEGHHRRKDGRVIDVEASVRALEEQGWRMVVFVRDITEQKRARAALQASEARFRALIEKASDMVFLLDAAGRYVFWSPGAAQALGWTADEVLGRSALEGVHPDDAAATSARLRALLEREGGAVALTMRARHRSGDWRVLQGVGRNLLAEPSVGAIVANLRDVTEQNALEDQLRHAQKMEAVGRLAGGVAHDFNNLLTVILASAEALREDLASGAAPRREDAEEIYAAGERARDLVRQLLAFARKQVIAPVPLDLNTVVRGCERMLRRLLGEDIAVSVETAPGLWTVLCDPGQIEQVVVNLAVNAGDAMPRGGALRIATSNADRPASDGGPAHWVRLVVQDNGTGISDEVRAHIFEPFFTTKETGKGTGLGLATVHGIVSQNGGEVHVTSSPGCGATFEVWLPRLRTEPIAPAATPSRAAGGGSETVLVIEDDPQVRAVTTRALRGAGYRVLLASGGDEALSLARSAARIDLVLSDVVMPGRSGRVVVDELRRERPSLRAVFMSGYPQDAIAQRGIFDPGINLLPKPFTISALLHRVRAVLDRG